MEMTNLTFVLQSLKGRCYDNRFQYARPDWLTLALQCSLYAHYVFR